MKRYYIFDPKAGNTFPYCQPINGWLRDLPKYDDCYKTYDEAVDSLRHYAGCVGTERFIIKEIEPVTESTKIEPPKVYYIYDQRERAQYTGLLFYSPAEGWGSARPAKRDCYVKREFAERDCKHLNLRYKTTDLVIVDWDEPATEPKPAPKAEPVPKSVIGIVNSVTGDSITYAADDLASAKDFIVRQGVPCYYGTLYLAQAVVNIESL